MFELDHIGVVVESLEQAVPVWCALLKVAAADVDYHDVPSEGVRIAMFRGNIKLELLEASDPQGSVQRFLEKRGAGLHHLCFCSEDAAADHTRLQAAGLQLLSAAPVKGAEGQVFFIHPKSTGGVLAEFVELDNQD